MRTRGIVTAVPGRGDCTSIARIVGSWPLASTITIHVPLRSPMSPKRPPSSEVELLTGGVACALRTSTVAPLMGLPLSSTIVPMMRPLKICALAGAAPPIATQINASKSLRIDITHGQARPASRAARPASEPAARFTGPRGPAAPRAAGSPRCVRHLNIAGTTNIRPLPAPPGGRKADGIAAGLKAARAAAEGDQHSCRRPRCPAAARPTEPQRGLEGGPRGR